MAQGPLFGSVGKTSQSNIFGSTVPKTMDTPVFGSTSTTQASVFGSMSSGTAQAPVFGSTSKMQTPVFGSMSSNSTQPPVFGGTNTTQTSMFGGTNTTQASMFGGTNTTQASVFGGTNTRQTPVFGGTNTRQAPVFGGTNTTQTSVFGSMPQNATQTPGFSSVSGFGSTVSTATFGSVGSSTFGGIGNTSQSSSSQLGKSSASPSNFSFGEAASQKNSVGQMPNSVFGAAKFPGFGQPAFGQNSSSFQGNSSSAFGGKPLFGGVDSTSKQENLFSKASSGATTSGGSNVNAPSGFGAGPTPVFGGVRPSSQSGNPFASSGTFIASSSAAVLAPVEPLFSSSKPLSSGSGEVEGSFRKRSSSGTMGSSALFGKRSGSQASFPTQVVSASQTMIPFSTPRESAVFKAESNKPTTQSLIGKEAPTGATSNSAGLFGAGNTSKFSYPSEMGNIPSHTGLRESESAVYPKSNVMSTNNAPFSSPPTMFGKPTSMDEPTSSSSTSQNLFTETSNQSAHLFGRQETSQQNLFGKAKEQKDLFGKSTSEAEQNLFGKPSTNLEPKTLFGKTNKDNERVLFGKQMDNESQGAFDQSGARLKEPALFGKQSDKKNQGLFGKPTGGNDQLLSGESTEASSSALFGHSNQSQSRQSASSSLFQGQETHQEPNDDTQTEKKGGVSSPSKRSLSKWSRGRDVDKRKARDETEQSSSKRIRAADANDTTPPAQRSRMSSIRQSTEEINSRKSLIVRDIPVHMNKGPVLRDHFSRFGTIRRLQPLPTKNSANITFKSHEEAKAAKDKGKHLGNGKTLSIFWRNVPKSPLTPSSTSRSPDLMERGDQVSLSNYTRETVHDELTSMAGTFDHGDEFVGKPQSPQKSVYHDLESEAQRIRPDKKALGRKRSPSPSPVPDRKALGRKRSPSPSSVAEEAIKAQSLPDIEVAKKLLKVMRKARPKDATEAIAILDARDKFLRLLRKRNSNLASAKAFKGTCEDMCPEKERYYREDIRRLALYEVIPSTMTSLTGQKSKVDHARAVKEYSRSSADQEEPLPHELRPLSVLEKTMDYLLSEVADQGGEGCWAEWYDFLWNRTRGIRKDITQQQLCEPAVAELLEKCTRFHVFCSAHLCEEDAMSFDAKINSENLTKCLQTLKELYADLDKKGITCQNEAEFRAYMVLMNLNEGDTLREVQQLRPEIRESAEIIFALKAYNALNSSNYVRFFRLIKQATLLNACVLHRYFNQIRGQALRIIMKAHRATGKNRVMYPVQELIRVLGFEDASQVEQFCDHFCLTVEGDEVVMDAQAFLEPESSIPEWRSQTLVEAKLEQSVGEVLNGGDLPAFESSTPFSSFDESGTFIIPPEINQAIERGLLSSRNKAPSGDGQSMEETDVTAPATVKEGLPNAVQVQRARMQFSNDTIKSIVRALILEELDAEMLLLAGEVIKEREQDQLTVVSVVDDISSSVVQDMARTLAEEALEEEEASVQQKLAEEMAAQRHRVFTALTENVVEETVSELSTAVATQEMLLVEKELHRQREERCSVLARDDLMKVEVDKLILDVAQDVFQVDVLAKRERLAHTESCVLVLRCRRFFQTWQARYVANVRVKRAMLDFPSTATARPVEERVQRLLRDRPKERIQGKSFYINNRAKLTMQSPMEVIQQQLYLTTHLSMASARRKLASLLQCRPLDLSALVALQLRSSFNQWITDELIEPDTTPLQWKLVLSFPQYKDSSFSLEFESSFAQWIRAKFCRDNKIGALPNTPKPEGEVLSVYHLKKTNDHSSCVPLGICVRAFYGVWTDNQELSAFNKGLLKGTSALVFVCSSAENLSSSDDNTKATAWKADQKRLHQMLKQKPQTPRLPLVLVVPVVSGEKTLTFSDFDKGLLLKQLHKESLLSAVHVSQVFIGAQNHPVEFFSEWTSQISSCLRFCASHIPCPPKLRVKPVSSYVEDSVVELYKAPVYQDLRTRTRLQMLHQSPNNLIGLYNDVMEHLAEVAASDSLRKVSWPAPEIDSSKQGPYPCSDWNSESHMCNLYELISQLRLPFLRYSDLESEDWAQACQDVWTYLATVTKKDSGSAKTNLFQQIAQILSTTRKNFDRLCWLASEDGPCEPSYTNMSWTDIIDACIHYKMLSLRSGHIRIRKPDDDDDDVERVEDFEEPLVYYEELELEEWEPPISWTEALRDTEEGEQGQIKLTVDGAATRRDQTKVEKSSDTVQHLTQHSTIHQTLYESTEDKSWPDLKRKLEKEREETQRFESLLSAAVASPSADVSNISLPVPHNFESHFSPIVAAESRARPAQNDHSTYEPLATPRRSLRKTDVDIQSKPVGNVKPVNDVTVGGDLGSEVCGSNNSLHSDDFSLSERLEQMKQRLASQREQDKLFELKLKRIMEQSV